VYTDTDIDNLFGFYVSHAPTGMTPTLAELISSHQIHHHFDMDILYTHDRRWICDDKHCNFHVVCELGCTGD
jgi:hypothetical protein